MATIGEAEIVPNVENKPRMADNFVSDSFDPFGLDAPDEEPVRPVLIAVESFGNSSQNEEKKHRVASPTGFQSLDSGSLDPFGFKQLSERPRSNIEALEADSIKAMPPYASPRPPPEVSRVTRSAPATTPNVAALPPKMLVKITVYEEASAIALEDGGGACRVTVEGSVYAQVQCSDAKRNVPFALLSLSRAEDIEFKPNMKFSQYPAGQDDTQLLVEIPKNEIGYVPVLHYTLQEKLDHLPALLERKVTIHDTSCRIALQVRSKLSNHGDLRDLTIVVAIPERVDGDTVEILRGKGIWDPLKRVVKFQLNELSRGESFMVSAQAKMWKPLAEGESIRFPAMMRCSSADDKISAAEFGIAEVDGFPCSLTLTTATSFRVLNRLT